MIQRAKLDTISTSVPFNSFIPTFFPQIWQSLKKECKPQLGLVSQCDLKKCLKPPAVTLG